MPKQIPFPTKLRKDVPKETEPVSALPDNLPLNEEVPKETSQLETKPTQSDAIDKTPEASPAMKGAPEETPFVENTPEETPQKTDLPSGLNMENVVFIKNEPIEIKPTQLRYFRNQAVSSYNFIKAIPLTTFFTYQKGVLGNRSPDEMLYDFLVAVFDSSEFVRDHYDEMTADDVDRIVKIFGRINHIDEKEEQARKNQQAQGSR